MAKNQIDNSVASNLSNQITDYSVSSAKTDGISKSEETTWENLTWAQNYGYYKEIPEIAAVIDALATWTVGKGFMADDQTTLLLDGIKGFGKDTFNTILENMIRTMHISGDSFAEIIRDDNGNFINLKPLDPETIKIHVNGNGIITKYTQFSKVNRKTENTFKPEELFHLARNRVADQIHGTSMVERLAWIILAKNEAMQDTRKLFHRYVVPRWIIKLNTDNSSEISAFKTKMDKANADGENMYVPMDSVELEQQTIAPNSTLNPLSWIESLDEKFYQAARVPKIIVGGTGGITEAAVKIAYLAFQQTIEEEQLFIEEQVGLQLGIAINLEFPASLENEILAANQKDGAQNIDPSETTAGRSK